MNKSKFRYELRKLVTQYLDSPAISPALSIKAVAKLVDNMPDEEQPYAEELGQEVVCFFNAIYNYYQGFVELGGGWITSDTIAQEQQFRNREIRTMRYVKGLFRKGFEFGCEFPA